MNAQQAHAHALITDRRYYVTYASNAVCELRYSKVSKAYFLHTACASYKLDALDAHAVYECVKRHAVRVARATSNMRSSVYTLRSDLRAVIRYNKFSKFAH